MKFSEFHQILPKCLPCSAEFPTNSHGILLDFSRTSLNFKSFSRISQDSPAFPRLSTNCNDFHDFSRLSRFSRISTNFFFNFQRMFTYSQNSWNGPISHILSLPSISSIISSKFAGQGLAQRPGKTTIPSVPFASLVVRWTSAGSPSQEPPSGESRDDCARGGGTSSSRSLHFYAPQRTAPEDGQGRGVGTS